MSFLSWPRARLDERVARAAVAATCVATLATAGQSAAMANARAVVPVAQDSVPTLRTGAAPASAGSVTGSTTGSVTGIVRGGGGPLVGAHVGLGDDTAAARTDGAGTYLLTGVPAGTTALRVSANGYAPLSLDVTVAAGTAVRVDVTLTRLPTSLTTPMPLRGLAELAPVRVIAPFTTGTPTTGDVDTLGRWHWTGSPSASTLASGEPDIFRVLADDPTLAMRPDAPPTLMNRGGGGDQTLILLDGLPLWSPFHAGSALSAITPDAVAGLTLDDGAFSARHGGRLGGTLDVSTRAVPRDAATGSAAVGPMSSRLMWGTPLWGTPLARGSTVDGVLLAVRRSNRDLFTRNRDATAQALVDRWADGVGSVRLGGADASVTLLALASSDHLRPGNWDTRTAGVAWSQRVRAGAHAARLDTRAWDARFGATVRRSLDTTAALLDDAVHHTGVSTLLAFGGTTVGASLEALRVRYHVSAPAAPAETAYPPLDLRASPVIYAAFAEHRWGTSLSPLMLQAGMRATTIRGVAHHPAPFIEPRVTVSARPRNGVTAMIGYARTHQFVQSLRNDASLLGSVIGIDLPAAAGGGGVPVAHSHVATAGVTAPLGPNARLALDGYVRSLRGLVVPDPDESGLFAARELSIATGRASGAGASVAGASGRFTWQAMYGVGRSTVRVDSVTYHPASELGHAASASIALQADRLTQLRLAGWASGSHQLVRLGQMGNEWSGNDAEQPGEYELEYGPGSGTGGTDDDAGSFTPTTGSSPGQPSQPAPAHLPVYLRVDLSVTHDWHTGPGRLSMFVTVANVFNRANVAAYTTSSGSARRTVALTPRSLLAGASWRY